MAWIIFAAIAVPILGILIWVILDDSLVRVAPGRLGLLLVRGAPTDDTLEPGVHWVPRLRRRMVVEYPALELAYRAGDAWTTSDGDDQLERSGPALSAPLGDRTVITVGYTVRFRLDVTMIKVVHTRFGTEGIWAAVRDESGRTLRDALGDARFGIDDLFGPARRTMETELSAAMAAGLAPSGLVVTMFNLGDLDLGRAGDAIQAIVRARLELQREEAEAAMRMARARIDAELAPYIDPATSAAALRYREVDSWRDVVPMRGAGPATTVGGAGPSELPGGVEPPPETADGDR
jgi:regulator of protease activity HflC (stomatin/prohibitin superfamily)